MGEQQIAEIRKHRRIKAAELHKQETERLLAEAELELAQADTNYSALKLREMTLSAANLREGSTYEAYVQSMQVCSDIRARLWTIASSRNSELILSTARQYGDQCRITWALGQEVRAMRNELEQVKEAFRAAGETRRAAVQKRGRAKANHEAALAAISDCYKAEPNQVPFNLESALISAANALTGTSNQCYAYSFCDTLELPIEVPEDLVGEQ